MPRTLKDSEMQYAIGVVTQTIEPRIKALVEEVNKFFESKGIRAGVELQWYFDGTDPTERKQKDKSK